MTDYRIKCEVIIPAEDAARASDILRDCLAEVNGTLDEVEWVEISVQIEAGDPAFPDLWPDIRELSAEVAPDEEAA